jgi:hypothetical protein
MSLFYVLKGFIKEADTILKFDNRLSSLSIEKGKKQDGNRYVAAKNCTRSAALSQEFEFEKTAILRVIGVDLLDSSQRLKRMLYQMEGVSHVFVNHYTEKVHVVYDPSKICLGEIRRIVAEATFQKDDSKIILVNTHF